MEYKVKILDIEKISKNVKRFRVEKPEGYNVVSGQHGRFKISNPDFEDVIRVFSFSSPDSENYLEFMPRIYGDRDSGTKQFDELKVGDELELIEPRGKINYIGKGTFIAGGIGISPLVSILRKLNKEGKLGESKLIYMDKTKEDLVLEDELKEILGDNVSFTLTREKQEGYLNEKIDKNFLEKHLEDFDQKFYLCGPFDWVKQLKSDLVELGAKEEDIVSEI